MSKTSSRTELQGESNRVPTSLIESLGGLFVWGGPPAGFYRVLSGLSVVLSSTAVSLSGLAVALSIVFHRFPSF
jgi:hypothetical protein